MISCSSKKTKIKKQTIIQDIKKEDTFISNKVERNSVFNPYKVDSTIFKKIKTLQIIN